MDKLYALTNGKIVLQEKILENSAILLRNEYIEDIINMSEIGRYVHDIELIDCAGNYILPGLIDIHSDMVERIIAPRRGVKFDYELALHEADRQLISQGITTIYHSISIANSTICNRKRTLSVEEMIGIGDAIDKYQSRLLINHCFHARLELNTIEAFPHICDRIKQGKIHELSLMNHAPGQGQYTNWDLFKNEIKRQYGEISETRMTKIIRECLSKPLLPTPQIEYILELAHSYDIPLAFHDLETKKQLSFMLQNRIQIGEFPLNMDIAKEAFNSNIYNLVGAPNILKGKSHNNNASAIELLKKGWAKIICSDYYSPSLLVSLFLIPKISELSLSEAVCFASYYPAKAIGIDSMYGSISPGKIADIIIIDASKNTPCVVLAFINGKITQQLCYEHHAKIH